MVEPVAGNRDEEMQLLSQPASAEHSWRLNFDGFNLSTEHQQMKQPRGLHDYCLGVLELPSAFLTKVVSQPSRST
ncbi:hypothetical protein CRG98_044385 [Punica granatum]|uniref:Uncharacterized protein n=1 Tax=Punica granatum TaxID=22663 RepID=A0A2I0HU37_PUNGR|nr:hypothetical protein CRG98_044385 [Punica granatum]